MNTKQITISATLLRTGPRKRAAGRGRSGIRIPAAGLALIWWSLGSPTAEAGTGDMSEPTNTVALCPAACCDPSTEPVDGQSAECTDFRVHLLDILFGPLGEIHVTADVTDEGWVWVNRGNAACPKFRSVSGVVTSSQVAENDTPANHNSYDEDVDIFVDPGQRNIVSTAGEDHDEDGIPDIIGMEWEIGTTPGEKHGDGARPTFPKWAWPSIGDRAWTEGHWVFDCGHATEINGADHYRAEIHPARASAAMRNQSHVLPGTGVTPVPVTATDLWIHGRAGFVTSILNCGMKIITDGVDEDGDGFGDGDPDACPTKVTPIDTDFEFDVCLPPRPNLQAVLRWSVEEGPYNTIPNSEIPPVIAQTTDPAVLANCANDDVEGIDLYDLTTALHVRIPLAGTGIPPEEAYGRHIYAGWVSPPDPPLSHLQLTINQMVLHNDTDDLPFDDGELSFFWTNLDVARDAWLRMVDFERPTFQDCQFPCSNHTNTMDDYDDDGSCCQGELDFVDLTYNFYVRNGQSFTLRTRGFDQDCYDHFFGDHTLSTAMYAACFFDIAEGNGSDNLVSLPSKLDPDATTFGPPGYGVGNHDLPARKTITPPTGPIVVSDYELELSIAEVPLGDEDTADLSVRKTCEFDGEVALTGEPFRCTIDVRNSGPGLPRNVEVFDAILTNAPAGSFTINTASWQRPAAPSNQAGDIGPFPCSIGPADFSCGIGTIPVGESITVRLQITANKPGTFRDRAVVTTLSRDAAGNNISEAVVEVFQKVDIDILPGINPNPINLGKKGVIPVAVLTTSAFNAATINPATVCFGDAEAPGERDCTESHGTGHLQDVDRDRDVDMLLHYDVLEVGIDLGDTRACLIGRTFSGTGVYGCGPIVVVPPH